MLPGGPPLAAVVPTLFLVGWIGCALLMVAFPRLIWRIRYSWRAIDAPPPLYFWTTRLWGALCAAAAIGLTLFVHIAR